VAAACCARSALSLRGALRAGRRRGCPNVVPCTWHDAQRLTPRAEAAASALAAPEATCALASAAIAGHRHHRPMKHSTRGHNDVAWRKTKMLWPASNRASSRPEIRTATLGCQTTTVHAADHTAGRPFVSSCLEMRIRCDRECVMTCHEISSGLRCCPQHATAHAAHSSASKYFLGRPNCRSQSSDPR
jgi:hypothetical protein